jgi:cystathionine beta-lyase/cystathionine gamma-synthase
MPKTFQRLETKLIHAGEPDPRINGAVNMPIFQSANFEYAGEEDYHRLKYIRLSNTPNHTALHQKLAALENAEDALVTASGMAAISTALLAVLAPRGHLLIQDSLYGGTHSFVTRDLGDLGIEFTFIDADKPEAWESLLRSNTKAIYVEAIANPLLQIPDLNAVAGFSRVHGLVSMIDNTFPSPVNFRPAELGFDLSLHSCTKYLNGHSDIVAGAVIGRSTLVKEVKRRLDHFGGSLDPHAAFLLHRGMKTLAVRVRCQNESALKIARFLSAHRGVARVHYPGLESHAQHKRAAALFDGFGGMVSFELHGGLQSAQEFMRRVTIPIGAPSLGGVETLVTRPATTSHSSLSPQDRQRLGITDSLIRLSVGIESVDEIIEDFDRALAKVSA